MDSVGAPVVQEQHHHVKCSNAMNSCPGNSCQCKWWTVTAAANGSGAVLLELSMQWMVHLQLHMQALVLDSSQCYLWTVAAAADASGAGLPQLNKQAFSLASVQQIQRQQCKCNTSTSTSCNIPALA
jgi:hypothetical protein